LGSWALTTQLAFSKFSKTEMSQCEGEHANNNCEAAEPVARASNAKRSSNVKATKTIRFHCDTHITTKTIIKEGPELPAPDINSVEGICALNSGELRSTWQ
jgi:hypothetical protein